MADLSKLERLLEYLLPEQSKANLLRKAKEVREDMQKGVWDSRDQPSIAQEEADKLAPEKPSRNEEHLHFLQRKTPSASFSRDTPYEMYHMGIGSNNGHPIMNGKPMTSNEVLETLHNEDYSPHQLVVRSANKNGGWISMKHHPVWKYAFGHEMGRLMDRHINSSQTGKISPRDKERFKNQSLNTFNPNEMQMIANSHKPKR